MVIKGLKVGDVFEDGGLFYVVDKVKGQNYISHVISEEEKGKLEKTSSHKTYASRREQ